MFSGAKRLLLLLLVLGFAGLAIFLTLWTLSRPTGPAPSPSVPHPVSETEPSSDEAFAWIGGEVVSLALLHERQAIDRAVGDLLGAPVNDEAEAAERLVNELLVLRAANEANFQISPQAVDTELEALLAAQGKTLEDLEAALLAEGLTLETFRAYFARLITVRDFSALQAEAEGVTVDAYVLQLRQEADVRVAEDLAAADSSPSPKAPPSPTPEVPLSTPTVTPTPAPRGTQRGQLAPDFKLSLLGPEPLYLSLDELRGQPIVLSFWVSWCGHCRAQTPFLREAYASYGPEGVHFVGVNVREAEDVVQQYVAQQEIDYDIVLDTEGAVAQLYGISGFPTTYFIDAQGQVVDRHVGSLNAQTLDHYLELMTQ
ncbi:MAG: redoxin family protein [Anaerolineales bacterium]